MAPQSESPIIHASLMCENIRTGGASVLGRKGLQPTTFAARFWSKVDRRSDAECWMWVAAQCNGYGYIRIQKRPHQAHRISWELANRRPVPEGLVVRHSCDVRLCVNPAHLDVGTQRDNVRDAITRGRHVFPRHLMVRNQYMPEARPVRRRA